jgi:uncharacterized protein YuzE
VSLRIGSYDFEHATYDEVADVLYLRTDDAAQAATTHGTPEGHAVRMDAEGKVLGITIVNARWLSEREAEIVVSIPHQRIKAPARDLGAALKNAISE